MQDSQLLDDIRQQLVRLGVEDARVQPDDQFEPQAGTLVKLCYQQAEWHLVAKELLELLEQLEDGAGGEAMKRAIEARGVMVWHGPAPRGPRDSIR